MSSADKKYARFRLAERPQRAPGTNAYFEDLKEEMGRAGGSAADSEAAVDAPAAREESHSRVEDEGTGGRLASSGAVDEVRRVVPERPRRVSARPAAASAGQSPSSAGEITEFSEFERRWARFVSGTLMKACQVVFENTVAVGREYYDTQNAQIRQAIGRSKRQTFAVMQELERMGFITREELKENNGFVGVRIWFHTNPISR